MVSSGIMNGTKPTVASALMEMERIGKSLAKRFRESHEQESPRGSSGRLLQVNAYVKAGAEPDERQYKAIPVMVSVTPTEMAQRAPVDLVAVLHVRDGTTAPVNWRELVWTFMDLVVDKLDGNDRLAIVPVRPTLLPMSVHGRAATCGEVRSHPIRSNMSLTAAIHRANEILSAREYIDFKNRTGAIILISNSVLRELCSSWSNYPIHTLGFRNVHNTIVMHRIAEETHGTYSILDDELGRIAVAVPAIIHGSTSSVIFNEMKVYLSCRQYMTVTMSDIEHCSFWCCTPDDNVRVYHEAEAKERCVSSVTRQWCSATRSFIVYLYADNRCNEIELLPELLSVRVEHWPNLKWSKSVKINGEVSIATEGTDGSSKVAAEITRLAAMEIVDDIVRKGKDVEGKIELHDAAVELHDRWRSIQNSDHGREASGAGLISRLAVEMREMEERLLNNYMWQEYMLSWLTCQALQMQLPPLSVGMMQLRILSPNKVLQLEPVGGHWRPAGLPVMVRVMAPAAGYVKLVSIDVIIVLDISANVGGDDGASMGVMNKPELAKKAIELVMAKLHDKDRLAIIPVQSSSTITEPPRLSVMSARGRRETSAKVQSLMPSQKSTAILANDDKWDKQVFHWLELLKIKAMYLVGNCLPITSINSPICSKLHKALTDAVMVLDDRQGTEKDRVGSIILISDGGDDITTTMRHRYCVHAFGFRGKHDAEALHQIASSSGGSYAVLDDDHGQLTEAFVASRITSVVAVQTEVDVVCNHSYGATVSSIESGQFMSNIHGGRTSGSISVGALHAGAVKNFLVYVDLPKDRHHNESSSIPADLLTAHVKYVTAKKEEEVVQANLFTAENDLGAAAIGTADIAAEILRVQVTDVVTNVLRYKDRKFRATGELHEGWMRVKSSELGQAAGWARLTALQREVAAMEASLLDGSGLSHLLSWLSFQKMSEHLPSKLELEPEDSTASGERPGLPPFQLQPERPA